jgi:SAM-dependent methyltransferase
MKIIMDAIKKHLSNEYIRRDFVKYQLQQIPAGTKLLDAGCGSQQYRCYCNHLDYKSQDFAQYSVDLVTSFTDGKGKDSYTYGEIDYIGNIWDIPVEENLFDTVLCTEVFEHILYPNETVREFSRILKINGKLILTAPSNCLRHFDPYFFYTGFSDNYFRQILSKNGFRIDLIEPVGDYYSWLAVELARTMKLHGVIWAFLIFPAFLFYALRQKTEKSVNTLCMGYHIVACKIEEQL